MVYWALALLPALLHPLIFLGYRRTLISKRAEVRRLTEGHATKLYRDAYRREPDYLFQRLYGNWLYIIPLAIIFCLVVLAAVAVLARAGLAPAGIPKEALEKIAAIPFPAIAGIVGAFIWGLYDCIYDAQLARLTPPALHIVWFRLLLGASLAPLLVAALAPGLQAPTAFFIPALPIPAFIAFGQKIANERLGIGPTSQSSEPATLHHLQGLTENVIRSLASAGVDSTQHLAHGDPINLFLRTNVPWKVILDLIDQALLFNYVGDKLLVFRPSGIRGAVELAALARSKGSRDPDLCRQANELIDNLASQSGTARVAIDNAILTAAEDLQQRLIAELWGTTFKGQPANAVRGDSDITLRGTPAA